MGKFNRKLVWIWVALLATGCSVPTKGILLTVEPATPIDQRDLHQYCDLGDQAACALYSPEDAAQPPLQFAIVQGVATPDRAVFAAVIPKTSSLSWFIYDRDLGRLWKLHDSRKQMRATGDWYVQRIEARQLEPGRTYDLLAGDKEGRLVESRSFRTLAAEGKALRFAVVSGLKGSPPAAADRLLASVTAKSPQLVLFAGGNIDAHLNPKKAPAKRSEALDFFFEKHLTVRNSLAFARERRLVPVAGTWNESEFGLAQGDRTFAFKDQAREVFEIFFPVWADEATIMNGPGLSKSFPISGQSIALLDEHSFRLPPPAPLPCVPKLKGKKKMGCITPPAAEPTPASRFGDMQARWAFGRFGTTKQPVWLISAGPWLGAYQGGIAAQPSALAWMNALSARAAVPLSVAPGTFLLVDSNIAQSGLSAQLALLNADGGVISSSELNLR